MIQLEASQLRVQELVLENTSLKADNDKLEVRCMSPPHTLVCLPLLLVTLGRSLPVRAGCHPH